MVLCTTHVRTKICTILLNLLMLALLFLAADDEEPDVISWCTRKKAFPNSMVRRTRQAKTPKLWERGTSLSSSTRHAALDTSESPEGNPHRSKLRAWLEDSVQPTSIWTSMRILPFEMKMAENIRNIWALVCRRLRPFSRPFQNLLYQCYKLIGYFSVRSSIQSVLSNSGNLSNYSSRMMIKDAEAVRSNICTSHCTPRCNKDHRKARFLG